MELAVVVPVAIVAALLTIGLCDLAGSIARAKGRSYWAFFALGLLLWFPSLILALALPARTEPVAAPPPHRAERVLGAGIAAVGALTAVAGLAAAVAFAP